MDYLLTVLVDDLGLIKPPLIGFKYSKVCDDLHLAADGLLGNPKVLV